VAATHAGFHQRESMGEDFCHDLLGVKMCLGDLPGGLALPPVAGVYNFKGIGGILKRQETKHPFSVGKE